MTRFLGKCISLSVAVGLLIFGAGRAAANDDDGDQNSKNMKLVGFSDLQSRSTYQPVVHKQGGRYIAYTGHHTLGTNPVTGAALRSEEHTSELQSRLHLVCRLLLEKKKKKQYKNYYIKKKKKNHKQK